MSMRARQRERTTYLIVQRELDQRDGASSVWSASLHTCAAHVALASSWLCGLLC